jgi:hypothetical protein
VAADAKKDAKKTVTIAVNAALNAQIYPLRSRHSKSGPSILRAMARHGHTNCSPERPKQNFLPTLTS